MSTCEHPYRILYWRTSFLRRPVYLRKHQCVNISIVLPRPMNFLNDIYVDVSESYVDVWISWKFFVSTYLLHTSTYLQKYWKLCRCSWELRRPLSIKDFYCVNVLTSYVDLFLIKSEWCVDVVDICVDLSSKTLFDVSTYWDNMSTSWWASDFYRADLNVL